MSYNEVLQVAVITLSIILIIWLVGVVIREIYKK
jgi:hypothetical protein